MDDEAGNPIVMSAAYNPATGTVTKKEVMRLALAEGEKATDLFAHTNVVTVRINDGDFKFFPYPLVAGGEVSEIEMDMGDAENMPKEDINMAELLAYGMGESKNADGAHVYTLYGVFANSLIKCSHVHD